MELRYLESFLALATTLHFGRAADRVCLSQSALSRQIQSLEAELQAKLFERSGRRVALTSSGRTLVVHAERVLEEMRQARVALCRQTGTEQGSISVSCFDGAGVYLIPRILATLHELHPCVVVSVATLNSREALRAVREGAVDAAMVILPVTAIGIHVVPLFQEEMVLLLPAHHHLGTIRRVPIHSLRDEQLIAARPGQNTRQLIDQAFSSEGGVPTVVYELESVQARKDAVRSGLGIAIMGMTSVLKPVRGAGLTMRPLSPSIYRSIGLICRPGRSRDPLVALFARTAAATAIRLGCQPAGDVDSIATSG